MQNQDALSLNSAKSINGLSRIGSITRLPLGLTFHGHHLRQVWRKADVAVFERSFKKDRPAHEFELVIIRTHKACVMPSGAVIPAGESYPSSGQWGQYGWSLPVRERAPVFALAEALANRGEARISAIVRSALSKTDTPTTPGALKSAISKTADRLHVPAIKRATLNEGRRCGTPIGAYARRRCAMKKKKTVDLAPATFADKRKNGLLPWSKLYAESVQNFKNPAIPDRVKVTWILLQPILKRSEEIGCLVENGQPMSIGDVAMEIWRDEKELLDDIEALIRFRWLRRDERGVTLDPVMVLDYAATQFLRGNDAADSQVLTETSLQNGSDDHSTVEKSNSKKKKKTNVRESFSSSSTETGLTDSHASPRPEGASSGSSKLLEQWIKELTADFQNLNVAEVAKKWFDHCRKNNQPVTRERLVGWLKRERPEAPKIAKAFEIPAKFKAEAEEWRAAFQAYEKYGANLEAAVQSIFADAKKDGWKVAAGDLDTCLGAKIEQYELRQEVEAAGGEEKYAELKRKEKERLEAERKEREAAEKKQREERKEAERKAWEEAERLEAERKEQEEAERKHRLQKLHEIASRKVVGQLKEVGIKIGDEIHNACKVNGSIYSMRDASVMNSVQVGDIVELSFEVRDMGIVVASAKKTVREF